MATWKAFPHPNKRFDYTGAKLRKAWERLHGGDREPFPDAAWVASLQSARPALAKETKLSPEKLADALADAWRAFHRGDFQDAYEQGLALKTLGTTVANKAQGIHATHLMDGADKLAAFEAVAARAEAAAGVIPDWANAHYFRAFALGRYSQGISIAKALAQGLGGKIRESLERTLKLAPDHAEAQTAMGLYHAEIISKIGAMIGGLTYGAKADVGQKHLEKAVALTPNAPIAHIEYANGLLMLHGKKREDAAAAAMEKATQLEPADAMEQLDVEHANAQFE